GCSGFGEWRFKVIRYTLTRRRSAACSGCSALLAWCPGQVPRPGVGQILSGVALTDPVPGSDVLGADRELPEALRQPERVQRLAALAGYRAAHAHRHCAAEDRVRKAAQSGERHGAVRRDLFRLDRLAFHDAATGNGAPSVPGVEQPAYLLVVHRPRAEHGVDL